MPRSAALSQPGRGAPAGVAGLAAGTPVTHLFDIQTEDQPASTQPLAERLRSQDWLAGNEPLAHQLVRIDGTRVPVALTVTPLPRASPATGVVLVMHDQTRERAFLHDLAWQASHDALTGLLNRREFETRWSACCPRGPGLASLLFIDLDQFRSSTTPPGISMAIACCASCANWLAQQLGEEDCLARLGGDEFGVLLESRTPAQVEAVAERLRCCVGSLQFEAAGQGFRVGLASAWCTWRPGPGARGGAAPGRSGLLRGQGQGRNRIQVFAPGDVELDQRHGEMGLGAAPAPGAGRGQVSAIRPADPGAGQETVADRHVEVLMRLEEGERLIRAGAFIPAAERYGLMPDLIAGDRRGPWRASPSCPTGCSTPWPSTCPAFAGRGGLADFVRQQLQRWQIAPARICFEITETSAVANLDAARLFHGRIAWPGGEILAGRLRRRDVVLHLPQAPAGGLPEDRRQLCPPTCWKTAVDSAMVEAINQLGHLPARRPSPSSPRTRRWWRR